MKECVICKKPVEENELEDWYWGDEPAHMECVLKQANTICKECGYLYEGSDSGEDCQDGCGGTMRLLTNEDKARFRKDAGEKDDKDKRSIPSTRKLGTSKENL
jgi:hypothetical protein